MKTPTAPLELIRPHQCTKFKRLSRDVAACIICGAIRMSDAEIQRRREYGLSIPLWRACNECGLPFYSLDGWTCLDCRWQAEETLRQQRAADAAMAEAGKIREIGLAFFEEPAS